MVKYGWQRNYMLQDLTGLEILISKKASKTKNWFASNRKQVCQKSGVSIPSLKSAKNNKFHLL